MTVTWTVTPVGYQHIAKRCPACNVKRDFAPSGAIRVNSQKKLLDIWSIYKCTRCDYTEYRPVFRAARQQDKP